MTTTSRLAVSLLVLPLLACGGEREVTLQLEGLVGDEPMECGGTYSGVGTTSTDLTMADLRLYVHDVRLVTAAGEELEVALEQDGVWQHEDVVLLDFEDGGTACPQGTPEMNTTIRGTVPDGAEITGVRFTLGVPEARNHEDVTTAPSPLNHQTMYWNWNGGHIFFRLDASSTGLSEGFATHLGSTGCEGDGRGNVTSCVQENRVEVELNGYDPDVDTIAVDVAALFSESDLDADLGGAPGCRSGFDDMDCEPIFHGVGLPFAGTPPPGDQRLFRVVH